MSETLDVRTLITAMLTELTQGRDPVYIELANGTLRLITGASQETMEDGEAAMIIHTAVPAASIRYER